MSQELKKENKVEVEEGGGVSGWQRWRRATAQVGQPVAKMGRWDHAETIGSGDVANGTRRRCTGAPIRQRWLRFSGGRAEVRMSRRRHGEHADGVGEAQGRLRRSSDGGGDRVAAVAACSGNGETKLRWEMGRR